MTEKRTLILGGNEYPITVPLTLGQVADIQFESNAPTDPDPQEAARKSIQRIAAIIAAAARPEHPELTGDAIIAMRMTYGELQQAFSVVLMAQRYGAKEPPPGEAAAGAPAAA